MPIPELDSEGFLPPGIFQCSLDECLERFGQFGRTGQRLKLAEKLREFYRDVESSRMVVTMIVDGSFTTAKAEPDDVDLLLLVSTNHNFASDLRPFEYNVLSGRQVRRRFGFDVFVAAEHSIAADKLVAFFSQIRGRPDRTKGLLQISLTKTE